MLRRSSFRGAVSFCTTVELSKHSSGTKVHDSCNSPSARVQHTKPFQIRKGRHRKPSKTTRIDRVPHNGRRGRTHLFRFEMNRVDSNRSNGNNEGGAGFYAKLEYASPINVTNTAFSPAAIPQYQDSFDPGSCNDRKPETSSNTQLPITMPSLDRPLSPLQPAQDSSRFRSEFGFSNRPSRWYPQEMSEYEYKYRQIDHSKAGNLKKPPPNYSSSGKKRHTTRKSPPSYSAEANKPILDRKPPPPLSNVISSKAKLLTTKNASRIRARSSKLPAVPQAIDVNLSHNTNFDQDSSQTPSPLSPISFSSSMYHKNVHYYPSRDAIEKELSSLPPIRSVFDDHPSKNTPADTSTKRERISEEVTSAIRNDRITRTAQPTSEESSASALNNRPEKPLRINSHFPSQLQLQKQRQQQQQKQQQQQQSNTRYYPDPNAHYIPQDDIVCPQPLPKGDAIMKGIATGIKAHLVPRDDNVRSDPPLPKSKSDHSQANRTHSQANPTRINALFGSQEEIPSPQPLPKGNGITSRVATRIDAERPNFVPLEHKEEYDLQLSKPSKPAKPVHVEIYPGVSVELRGAQETSKASKRNFVVESSCLICTLKSLCIADAAFVICPSCLVVNPLNEATLSSKSIKAQKCRGVGLGYTHKTTDRA